MRRKRVLFISISLAVMVAALGWYLLMRRQHRPIVVVSSLELHFSDLFEYYRQHGEYPDQWEPYSGSLHIREFGSKTAYFTAKDKNGKRFACLVLCPGPDNQFQINGECFAGSNVGKKPLHWTPRKCATDRYFVRDEKDIYRNAGKGDDWYFQFIWGKYCVLPMDGYHVGSDIYDIDELPDLSNPPPLPWSRPVPRE